MFKKIKMMSIEDFEIYRQSVKILIQE